MLQSSSHPILCLVTDRHRLAAHLGMPVGADDTRAALLAQVTAAARAGVALVHVRERDLSGRVLADLVRDVVACVRGFPTAVVVNDRADVAIAADALGVHLTSVSMDAATARRLVGETRLVGQSVHTAEEAETAAAGCVDYLVFGSVFPTRSKPAGWPVAGVDRLQAVVAAARGIPVLAIGGVGAAEAARVASAGAAGLAAIDAFLPADRASLALTVRQAVERLRFAFDSDHPLT